MYADKHQSLYKLALSFLMEVARSFQSTQNRKLVIFLQYLKKKMSKLLLCSTVIQNIQIFYGGEGEWAGGKREGVYFICFINISLCVCQNFL